MNKATLTAILSAVFYALSIPLSKILLSKGVNPVVLGGFTYLGAGVGLLIINLKNKFQFNNPLTKKEIPYTIAMVVLDILAITLLMFGLLQANPLNASLLSNFEIAATSLIAFLIFKEHISKKLWSAVFLIIIAGIILTCFDSGCLKFNLSSLLVLGAYLCWGMENNCTKMISSKNTQEITIIKGIFSGLGSLVIAYFMHYPIPEIKTILLILFIGFISFGISVSMYISAQNKLGASKTAACFSFAPYIATFLSLILFFELPDFKFFIALIIMLTSLYLIYKDNVSLDEPLR